jgi:hypothetical protein
LVTAGLRCGRENILRKGGFNSKILIRRSYLPCFSCFALFSKQISDQASYLIEDFGSP